MFYFVDDCAMMGLRCLALLFVPIKCKRMEDSIPYIAKVVPVSYIVCKVHKFSYVCYLGLVQVYHRCGNFHRHKYLGVKFLIRLIFVGQTDRHTKNKTRENKTH